MKEKAAEASTTRTTDQAIRSGGARSDLGYNIDPRSVYYLLFHDHHQFRADELPDPNEDVPISQNAPTAKDL
jgi:hypothetical protein